MKHWISGETWRPTRPWPQHGSHVRNRIVAGGTDLIPSMRQKLFEPRVRARHPPHCGTKGHSRQRRRRRRDRRADFAHAQSSIPICCAASYPVLTEAAATVASPVLRNMGTIGGNICLDTRCLWYNQSLTWRKGCGFCIKKDGDLVPCRARRNKVLGGIFWRHASGVAVPECRNRNRRTIGTSPPAAARLLYRHGRRLSQASNPMNWSREFSCPSLRRTISGVYRKLRVRGSIDYPLAGVAVAMKRSNGHIDDARLAITAVNPAPVLVKGATAVA